MNLGLDCEVTAVIRSVELMVTSRDLHYPLFSSEETVSMFQINLHFFGRHVFSQFMGHICAVDLNVISQEYLLVNVLV